MDEVTGDIYSQELKKLGEIEEMGIEPYARTYFRSSSIKNLRESCVEDKEVMVAGRIMAVRKMGKALFADIKDFTDKIQLYIRAEGIGEGEFLLFKKLGIGDIIGIKGATFKTKTGELTIKVEKFTLLAKSLRALPEKWHGLRDIEIRYRQRYLDLITNDHVKETFVLRSKIISAIRKHLDSRGYLEVETPMMQHLAGGAVARPFITHHESLNTDFYLRIAPELYLKRLLVGGFEKIYEIGKNFRNEGLSRKHNPEFTMLEVYTAYSDYKEVMTLTEDLIASVAGSVLQKREITVGRAGVVNLEPPWKKITFYEALEEYTGVDFRTVEDTRKAAVALGVQIDDDMTDAQIANQVFEKCVEEKLVEPVFVLDYPAELCPLSKTKKGNTQIAERFELFINGQEVANAYSELNDPIQQRARFKQQIALREEGEIDEDYVTALEYGMPPAGGLGIGIDRLVMVLTNSKSIKDVILFPQLKSESTERTAHGG